MELLPTAVAGFKGLLLRGRKRGEERGTRKKGRERNGRGWERRQMYIVNVEGRGEANYREEG